MTTLHPNRKPSYTRQEVEQFENRTIDRLMDMALDWQLEQRWDEHDKLGAYCGITLQLPLSMDERRALLECRDWHATRERESSLFSQAPEEPSAPSQGRPMMLSLGDALRLHAALATFSEQPNEVVGGLLRETMRIALRGICAARHFQRLDEDYGIATGEVRSHLKDIKSWEG